MSASRSLSEDDEPDPDAVEKPNDRDVLCGRGGLTNTHPGNAWYRNLVRANRPFYRSSPKHGKILVAKAIVDHVFAQDPPCRFLEKSSDDARWYPVNWKRSVDKTSQALRERERHLEDPMQEEDTNALAEQMMALKNAKSDQGSKVQIPQLVLLPQPDYHKTEVVKRQSDRAFSLVTDSQQVSESRKRRADASPNLRFGPPPMPITVTGPPPIPRPSHTIGAPLDVEATVTQISARFWRNSVARGRVKQGPSGRSPQQRSLPSSSSVRSPLPSSAPVELKTTPASPGVELLSYLRNSKSPNTPSVSETSPQVALVTSVNRFLPHAESSENDQFADSQDDQFADPDDDEDPSTPLLDNAMEATTREVDTSTTRGAETGQQNGNGTAGLPNAEEIVRLLERSSRQAERLRQDKAAERLRQDKAAERLRQDKADRVRQDSMSRLGALCRVCKRTRFDPFDVPAKLMAETHPELVWPMAKPKSRRAITTVLNHCLKVHPHWPLWNTLSNVQDKFPSPPRGVNVFHRALAVAASTSPHQLGDNYNSSEEMNVCIAHRMGLAEGYIKWGPWEFNKERALQILASSMLRDYGTSMKMAIRYNWERISFLPHQDRVDLFNNIFVVPYCIDNLREKGELFPPIFPSKEGPDEAEDDGVEDQDDQREDQEMGEAKVEADEEDPAEEDAPTDTVKRK